MWVCLNDAFLSIVHKGCARDELLVRARRPGDVEKIFPGAKVFESRDTDYRYRAVVKRADVEAVLVGEARRITYGNFKGSVQDKALHDAYLRVWTEMSKLQPTRPYRQPSLNLGDVVTGDGFEGVIVSEWNGAPRVRVVDGIVAEGAHARAKKRRRRGRPRKSLKRGR